MLAEAVDMKEAVKEEMERRYPNCRIQLTEVRKNNGLLLHGISIYVPGSIMAPTIYIDGYIQNVQPLRPSSAGSAFKPTSFVPGVA